jgi:hypothetical protein
MNINGVVESSLPKGFPVQPKKEDYRNKSQKHNAKNSPLSSGISIINGTKNTKDIKTAAQLIEHIHVDTCQCDGDIKA